MILYEINDLKLFSTNIFPVTLKSYKRIIKIIYVVDVIKPEGQDEIYRRELKFIIQMTFEILTEEHGR